MTQPLDLPPGCKMATDEDLEWSLGYAMRFDERGKAITGMRREVMLRVCAARLVKHLRMSGYIILQKPPAKPHSA